MRSKKLLIFGSVMVTIIIVASALSGVFGEFHEDGRSELIGYVDEDGNPLDLDGNPIDEEIDDDDGADLTVQGQGAIGEEEAFMANLPGLNVTANEVQALIDSVDLSDLFEFRLVGQHEEHLAEIEIIIDTVDPLADSALMAEFEQVTTLILESLDITYSEELIEGMMRTVLETEAYVEFIQYTEEIQLVFGIDHGESIFAIAASD